MEAILLKSNSISDLELIKNLARKLGVEISKPDSTKEIFSFDFMSKKSNHDFLKSQGIWKNRELNARDLRNEAWKIQE